jgi:hypothetical protein
LPLVHEFEGDVSFPKWEGDLRRELDGVVAAQAGLLVHHDDVEPPRPGVLHQPLEAGPVVVPTPHA